MLRTPFSAPRPLAPLALALATLGVGLPTVEAQVPGETLERSLAGLDVLISLPEGHADAGPLPLVLFLHGGDRSNTRHHPARHAAAAALDFPFVVVAPHCTGGCSWPRVDFDAILRAVLEELPIDRARIYLTGYSMGGYGAWDLLGRSPQWFAAASPIAGGGDPERICAAREVPVRAVHGEADTVIPLAQSQRMIAALAECSGRAELVVLPGVDHGSWIPTYRDADFWRWMGEQRRQE